ncbi:hypothetical protein [Paracoccus seriniphilus]|uniref:hypothetical protein n=1 Tax=Paracoccus seriniphilus TaxID=184748 RepID=UPI0035641BA9
MHNEAFEAYQAFVDAGLARPGLATLVEALQDRSGRILWFAGFQTISKMARAQKSADVFLWKGDALDDRLIRHAAWSEVCQPQCALRPAEAARWYKILAARLPQSIAQDYFGRRGFNQSSAARQLGIGRSRLRHHLG